MHQCTPRGLCHGVVTSRPFRIPCGFCRREAYWDQNASDASFTSSSPVLIAFRFRARWWQPWALRVFPSAPNEYIPCARRTEYGRMGAHFALTFFRRLGRPCPPEQFQDMHPAALMHLKITSNPAQELLSLFIVKLYLF